MATCGAVPCGRALSQEDEHVYLKFGIAALQVIHVTAQLQILCFHTFLGQKVLPLKHKQLIHAVKNSDYI